MRNLIGKKDYIVTLLSSVLVSTFIFFLLKLILYFYGEDGLNDFLIIKRYQSFLVPILLLGYGVTLPKFIAQNKLDFQTIGFSLTSSVVGATVLSILVYKYNAHLFLAFCFSISVLLASLYYSILRGFSQFLGGAVINITFIIAIPSISLVLVNSIPSFIFVNLFLSLLWGLTIILLSWRTLKEKLPKAKENTIRLPEFFKQSITRVPGDLFNQSLMLLPIQVCLWRDEFQRAAYISLALSFVAATSILLRPISTILLVSTAKQQLSDEQLFKSANIYILMCVILSLVYLCFTRLINMFYYEDNEFLTILQNLTIATFFYGLYVVLRSYVDVFYVQPILTYINLIGLLIMILLSFFTSLTEIDALNVAYGSISMMTLSMIFYRRYLHG